MHSPAELLALTNYTVRRNGQPVLFDISFTLKPGECWAVVGLTGSGKTTFLQALAGQFPSVGGKIVRNSPTEFISFKEESSRFSYSSYFYQQRYQATMGNEGTDSGYTSIPTLRDYLQADGSERAIALIERLGLAPLLDRSFLKLSNGQTRKARIGKALLRYPSILLLDNPFVGLDVKFRAELNQWLGELTTHGLAIVLVTEPEEMPPFVTHVLAIGNGRVQWSVPRKDYSAVKTEPTTFAPFPGLQTPVQPVGFTEAFRLQDVTVQYGSTVILNNVNWTVRAGERWALFGQNGAGKSVLLSLLYGDHPQAYSNQVYVFGHRRGKSGESIWDVKRRIGFVSPELHLYFPQRLTVREVALTGLTDTLTPPRRVTIETEADLQNLLTYFDVNHLTDRPFGTISTGEQRLVLLVRAFLKNAPVLLLDEPFQAIDARHVQLARQLIDQLPNKTILFVTHNKAELPDSVDKIFSL